MFLWCETWKLIVLSLVAEGVTPNTCQMYECCERYSVRARDFPMSFILMHATDVNPTGKYNRVFLALLWVSSLSGKVLHHSWPVATHMWTLPTWESPMSKTLDHAAYLTHPRLEPP